eukprot:2121726-Alexandrium_andersonii.AAC.1
MSASCRSLPRRSTCTDLQEQAAQVGPIRGIDVDSNIVLARRRTPSCLRKTCSARAAGASAPSP